MPCCILLSCMERLVLPTTPWPAMMALHVASKFHAVLHLAVMHGKISPTPHALASNDGAACGKQVSCHAAVMPSWKDWQEHELGMEMFRTRILQNTLSKPLGPTPPSYQTWLHENGFELRIVPQKEPASQSASQPASQSASYMFDGCLNRNHLE